MTVSIATTCKLICVAVLSIVVMGCSDSLSRDEAAQQISNSEEVDDLRNRIWIQDSTIQSAEAMGLAETRGRNASLTAKTAAEFSRIADGRLFPVSPATVNVEITGIVEGAGESPLNTVEFDWKYQDLSPLVRRFALAGGKGRAQFAKYDDGWRVGRIELEVSDTPYAISSADRQAIAADIEANQNSRERYLERVNASWEGNLIRTFEFERAQGDITHFSDCNLQKIEIFTTFVRYREFCGGGGLTRSVWFGRIQSIEWNRVEARQAQWPNPAQDVYYYLHLERKKGPSLDRMALSEDQDRSLEIYDTLIEAVGDWSTNFLEASSLDGYRAAVCDLRLLNDPPCHYFDR